MNEPLQIAPGPIYQRQDDLLRALKQESTDHPEFEGWLKEWLKQQEPEAR